MAIAQTVPNMLQPHGPLELVQFQSRVKPALEDSRQFIIREVIQPLHTQAVLQVNRRTHGVTPTDERGGDFVAGVYPMLLDILGLEAPGPVDGNPEALASRLLPETE